MRHAAFILTMAGNYVLQRPGGDDDPNTVSFAITGGWKIGRRKAIDFDRSVLDRNGMGWLWSRGNHCYIDLEGLRQHIAWFNDLDWLVGVTTVEPEVRQSTGSHPSSYLLFQIYRDEEVVNRQRQIFLSHKGVNKRLVRQYFRVLKAIGFEPWLDEDAMPAGTKLERGIRQGFEDSCAAVFFITPQFKDEGFLATEVDYAIQQERKKGKRFKIIPIVFADKTGHTGVVPTLLEPYVWKHPKTRIEALVEILKALPIEPGDVRWRADIGPP
jgi:TIR domain